MTWSWTSWLPAIRLRMSSALGGGEAPIAFSTARTDAMACTVVQTPQIRWAQIQASRGSLPSRIVSIPRNIVAAAHASATLPPRDVGLDAQVALDAGDRVNLDVRHRTLPS